MSKIKSILLKIANFFRLVFHYLRYNFKAHFKVAALVFLLSILVVGGFFAWRNYTKSTPEKTVRSFLSALEREDFDLALTFIYSEDRQKLALNVKIFEMAEIKFINLEINKIEERGNTAKVNLKGDMKIKIAETEQLEKLDELINLIKIDNRWYLRSLPIKGKEEGKEKK